MPHPILTQIAVLLGQFLSIEFGLPQAIQELGTVVQGEGSARVVLKPRAARSDYIILHLEDLNFAKGFLSSIEFAWTTPQTVKLSEMEEQFGPARILKGLRPEAPDTYLFDLHNRPLMGQILLSVQSLDKKDSLTFVQLTVRRFAPEPFSMQEERAVRFLVLADLGATEEFPNTWSKPSSIWKLSDIDGLMARLRPGLRFEVADRLGDGNGTLTLAFRPTRVGDFHPNAMIRHFGPLSALLDLRRAAEELERGEITTEEFRERVPATALPGRFRGLAETFLSSRHRKSADLVGAVDAALSDQYETVLRDPRLREFQSVWLGLNFLAEAVDFDAGSRIEVYSVPPGEGRAVLREVVLEDERNHPNNPPPLAIVLGGLYGPGGASAEELALLGDEATPIRTPVLFGADPSAGSFEPSAWTRTGALPSAVYLIGSYPRLALRGPLEASPTGLRCFGYVPRAQDPTATAVWGSGAWLLAALAARSLAETGLPADWSVGCPPPSTLGPKPGLPLLEPDRAGARAGSAAGTRTPSAVPLSRFFFDSDRQLLLSPEVRSLGSKSNSKERASALLILAPVAGVIRRIEHQMRRDTEAAVIRQALHAALKERVPGAEIKIDLALTSGGSGTLRVELQLAAPVDGQTAPLIYETPWKSPSR